LPGETIKLRQGQLFVNDLAVEEPYRLMPGQLTVASGTLLPRRYALLGDNRSLDAAESVHAVVSREDLLGRVILDLPLWSQSPTGEAWASLATE
jgi:hypothetical protein